MNKNLIDQMVVMSEWQKRLYNIMLDSIEQGDRVMLHMPRKAGMTHFKKVFYPAIEKRMTVREAADVIFANSMGIGNPQVWRGVLKHEKEKPDAGVVHD